MDRWEENRKLKEPVATKARGVTLTDSSPMGWDWTHSLITKALRLGPYTY